MSLPTDAAARKYPDGNPKTIMGMAKLPVLSVVPPAAILGMAEALRYGAFEAPNKKTGKPGYGPFNWRDEHITVSTYIDAAMRHLLEYWDGEDVASDSHIHHIKHAMAGLGILLDAIESGTVTDNRPAAGKASEIMARNVRTVQVPPVSVEHEPLPILNVKPNVEALEAFVANADSDNE